MANQKGYPTKLFFFPPRDVPEEFLSILICGERIEQTLDSQGWGDLQRGRDSLWPLSLGY